MKKIFLIPFFLLLFTSCSHVLNLVIAPFAPSFSPEVEATSSGPRISCYLTKDRDGTEDSWTQNYAYYIFRSTVNPYTDWELIARIYIPDSTRCFYGYEDNESKEYDFTLPNDGKNYDAYYNHSFIDTKAPTDTTIYYRLVKVSLSYDYSENDDGDITEEYELSNEISSWISVEN